ncbi:MAG: hypothetical protein QOJ35_1263 [Solirubrobacteraceae bacterium]|nr:hypothetical protein [Solirubrobacteraceae bacterium]
MSVVVVTRDRPVALERCLTALSWQTAKPLEIVVVDDAAVRDEAVRGAIARSFAAHDLRTPRVQVLTGGGRGPAAARNLGADAARGAVVCFIDDDCVPVPRWAERLAAACAAGGAAAGTTVADPAAGRAAAASQLVTHTLQLASLDAGAGVLGFAPTCNVACRSDVLRAVPFDESFPLADGEDRDWSGRLAAAGIALRFVPEARVEHRPQMGLVGLLRQQHGYGRDAVRLRGGGGGRRVSGRAFYPRLAREAARAGPSTVALVALAQAAVAAGALRDLAAGWRW